MWSAGISHSIFYLAINPAWAHVQGVYEQWFQRVKNTQTWQTESYWLRCTPWCGPTWLSLAGTTCTVWRFTGFFPMHCTRQDPRWRKGLIWFLFHWPNYRIHEPVIQLSCSPVLIYRSMQVCIWFFCKRFVFVPQTSPKKQPWMENTTTVLTIRIFSFSVVIKCHLTTAWKFVSYPTPCLFSYYSNSH